jgi:hypothetical protein
LEIAIEECRQNTPQEVELYLFLLIDLFMLFVILYIFVLSLFWQALLCITHPVLASIMQRMVNQYQQWDGALFQLVYPAEIVPISHHVFVAQTVPLANVEIEIQQVRF